MNPIALIELKNVYKAYGNHHPLHWVLNNVSLKINKGEMVAIVGASGSGKSTLMNLIGLLDVPNQGQILLNNEDLNQASEEERAIKRNRTIGFVFQQFHLLPRLSALENVMLPLRYRGLSQNTLPQMAREILERVTMLEYASRKPYELSGGQQQRIAIARALVGDPDLILADEPTGALDSGTGQEIMQLFHALHREGRTILIITHDANIARQCQRVITLCDGQVVGVS